MNRRRRRATPLTASYGGERVVENSHNYYDDDSDDGNNEKGPSRFEGRIFNGSCSFGQFVLNPCLCLFNTAKSCIKKQHRHGKNKKGIHLSGDNRRQSLLLLMLVFVVFVPIVRTILSTSGSIHKYLLRSVSSPPGRALSDEELDQIPVTIPLFDSVSNGRDIGGWKTLRRFFRPTDSLHDSMTNPDFGGLTVFRDPKETENARVTSNGKSDPVLRNELLAPARQINPNDAEVELEYWKELRHHDPHQHSYDMYPEELEDRKEKCRDPNWVKRYYPTCNAMHELTIHEDYDQDRAKKPGYDRTFDSFYISNGAFRDVWVTHQPFPNNEKSALKISRFKHDLGHRIQFNTLNDAMIMERLTKSPRIVDIFSHCGGSVWVEAMPFEMEEYIVPGEGMAKQKDLPKEVSPMNDYSVEEKLDIALLMAESLADLHGFSDGVIVHDDVQLCQWLRSIDGQLKLGDFNRAEVMQYNEKKGEYCTYYNGAGAGNYRAPEEFDKGYLNEKIDVFSFGNNIYALLTGLWVFYEIDDYEGVQKELIKGELAYVDPQWERRSYIEFKLVKLMEKCWIYDGDKRIDIFESVKQLRAIKKEHERRKANNIEWNYDAESKKQKLGDLQLNEKEVYR